MIFGQNAFRFDHSERPGDLCRGLGVFFVMPFGFRAEFFQLLLDPLIGVIYRRKDIIFGLAHPESMEILGRKRDLRLKDVFFFFEEYMRLYDPRSVLFEFGKSFLQMLLHPRGDLKVLSRKTNIHCHFLLEGL